MELKTYLKTLTLAERADFASRTGSTRGHLQNVAYGYRSCATDLAVRIERESELQVRRWDLLGDWANHWPELIGAVGAPSSTHQRHPATQPAQVV